MILELKTPKLKKTYKIKRDSPNIPCALHGAVLYEDLIAPLLRKEEKERRRKRKKKKKKEGRKKKKRLT